ncbi:MAG TPA: type II toxin-antitoxin system VapC family toxin [Pseudorhodoferax sp.]|nr:type II toxin-antitoxin system VapC family toxin [Pseudorhodoferax sp.]
MPPSALHVAEPPAHYLVLPPLVVDCSVLAGLLFQEAWERQAGDAIEARTLHAPHLLATELTSVALKKHRLGMRDIASDGLAAFAQLDIALHEVQPAQVLALAIRYQLSAYDAAYLWLAAELKAPLATFDARLGTAAQTHLASLD